MKAPLDHHSDITVTPRIYYGWWIVGACVLAAMIGNALGLFGVGVYLRAITASTGWATGTVSGAVTLFYVVSAVLLIPVGSGIARVGPSPIVLVGLAMAAGVAGMGHVCQPWHVYFLFPLMGIGWACLSTTAVATTLAPWFEKYQGRAVSIASLGASAGGMMGPPLLLLGADRIGFTRTTSVAAAVSLVVLLPLALFILRRRPEDMGLLPDGLPRAPNNQPRHGSDWSRADALRTSALQTTMIAFGLGMSVQIGLLTHQVTLLAQSLPTNAVAATISATAIAALVGRLGLAKFADRLDARATSSVVLMLAATSFFALAAIDNPVVLIGANILFGLTVGNVTTLSPIIVRREFGAAAFGPVFGVASCAIQLVTALGPGLYGLLHDASGSYREPLLIAATMDIIAAVVILRGRRGGLRISTPAHNRSRSSMVGRRSETDPGKCYWHDSRQVGPVADPCRRQ
jgi:MFS family permease